MKHYEKIRRNERKDEGGKHKQNNKSKMAMRYSERVRKNEEKFFEKTININLYFTYLFFFNVFFVFIYPSLNFIWDMSINLFFKTYSLKNILIFFSIKRS